MPKNFSLPYFLGLLLAGLLVTFPSAIDKGTFQPRHIGPERRPITALEEALKSPSLILGGCVSAIAGGMMIERYGLWSELVLLSAFAIFCAFCAWMKWRLMAGVIFILWLAAGWYGVAECMV